MNWERVKRECVYCKKPWLVVYEEEVRLPNGVVIPDYITTEVPDVAMVFAVTKERELLLVEQYKHGLGISIWDLPAGYMDQGEDPLSAARRELEEETGYIGGDWRRLCTVYFDENRHDARFYYFLARNVAAEGTRQLDDTEDILVHHVPVASALDLVLDGRIMGMHSSFGICRGALALDENSRLRV